MTKKNLKILEAFFNSEISKQPQAAIQSNYNKDGKIESYSVISLACDIYSHKDKSTPIDGYINLSYDEMLNKLTRSMTINNAI